MPGPGNPHGRAFSGNHRLLEVALLGKHNSLQIQTYRWGAPLERLHYRSLLTGRTFDLVGKESSRAFWKIPTITYNDFLVFSSSKGGSCQASACCRWSWWRGAATAWCQLCPQGRPLRSRQVGATLIVFRRCVRLWCSRDNVIDVFFGVLTGEECQLTCQFHGWGRLHAMQRPKIFLLRIKYREAFRWLCLHLWSESFAAARFINFPLHSECVMFTWFDHLEETFPSSCFLYNRLLHSLLLSWDQLIRIRCKDALIRIDPI